MSACIFISKIEPTASDEEIRNMIAHANELEQTENNSEVQFVQIIDCEHTLTHSKIVKDATCTNEGVVNTICIDCNTVIGEESQAIAPHDFITKQVDPTCTKSGEVYDICTKCDYKVSQKTISKLEHKAKDVVITERSCYSNGEIRTICETCNATIDTQYSVQYNHQWIYVSEVFPTPIKDGSITYRCYHCDTRKTEVEKFKQKGSVNLCIPSQRIDVEVFLGECNQSNTNQYDVSCDMNLINNNNPVFFGHSTRTLGRLYNLKVGDYIYFTIDGKTTAYKVTVSEEGNLACGGTNIQGKQTGELCISNKDKNTLHFFTCYYTPFNMNGRWIVLAEKV